MDQRPETEPDPQLDDDDVEAHGLLVEAQGRELQERRYREGRDVSAQPKPTSAKRSHPSRLRRLLGG